MGMPKHSSSAGAFFRRLPAGCSAAALGALGAELQKCWHKNPSESPTYSLEEVGGKRSSNCPELPRSKAVDSTEVATAPRRRLRSKRPNSMWQTVVWCKSGEDMDKCPVRE